MIYGMHAGVPEFQAMDLMQKQCCATRCFRGISQEEIEEIRNDFYSVGSETEQNQKVLDYFRQHCRRDNTILYTVSGREVCEVCWRMTYGIRYNKFTCLLTKFNAGVLIAQHGRLGQSQISDSTLRCTSWLRAFISKIGDHMPMSKDIHLPSCLTKADVYDLAFDDLTEGGMQCCSKTTFYRIWRTEFPHVKIPKVCYSMHSLQ
jgi:hypothetical protein